MVFRPFPVILVTILALGAVASTLVAAADSATPQIVLLDPGTYAQAKAAHEQRRGNEVTDVSTHAVDGFAATRDSADITRLKADPSVMSIEPKPINAWGNKGKSIWYSWTAPISGSLSLDTRGSNYDTLLAISTGSAISALTNVGEDVDRHRVGGRDARAEDAISPEVCRGACEEKYVTGWPPAEELYFCQ